MRSVNDTEPPALEARDRILRAAREKLLTAGYGHLTMDELASELGMSKKTLYQHFTGKDALAREIISGLGREVRSYADHLLEAPGLPFPQRASELITGIVQRLSRITPHALRDLQRFAPELHELILSMRRKNIPEIFGRLLIEGQRRGMVRRDLDPRFAAEFLLHALQGLMQPTTLEQLQRTPRQVFESAMEVFFGGVLTPAGHKDYEKARQR